MVVVMPVTVAVAMVVVVAVVMVMTVIVAVTMLVMGPMTMAAVVRLARFAIGVALEARRSAAAAGGAHVLSPCRAVSTAGARAVMQSRNP
jgi:hypothetical protein